MRNRLAASGVALIAVILLLAGLAAVAGPFLISSGLEYRESRQFAARIRARGCAEGALARALWSLTRTGEQAERAGYYGQPFDTPDWDTLDELAVNFRFSQPPALKGQKKTVWPAEPLDPDRFHDPRGEIWTAEVEDEQGKVNVNSASPALLGNLLGSAVLEERLGSSDTALVLADTYMFPADDDDRTIDGFIRVGREIMAYTSKTDTTLDGLLRPLFGTESGSHGRGALVYDARGWAVSAWRARSARGGGGLGSLQSVEEVRKIAAMGVQYGGKNYYLALSPAEYEAVERYLTAGSFRPKADGWLRREKITRPSTWETDRRRFWLKDNTNFGAGMMVRFLDDEGKVQACGRVRRAQYLARPSTAGAYVDLEYDVGFSNLDDGREFFMEVELPHAVNVNTARVAVLAACMTGVALRGRMGVSCEQALLVAQRLVDPSRGAIRDRNDLDAVLVEARAAGEISEDQRQALLENASVSGSTQLRLCTTPFCFRAYSLFTVEATATVNNPASGRPLATHTIRELVQMPTAFPGVFLVRSQKEFDEQMRRAGIGRKVVTWPVPLVEKSSVPDESTEDGIGDVRLGTGRAGRVLPGTRVVDNFDKPDSRGRLTPDGLSLGGGGALRYRSSACFARSGNGRHVAPGSLEMWVSADLWGGSLFRSAEGATTDMLDVRYEADAGELVMELADGTLEGRTVSYRQPYNLEPKTWFHIRAGYKSTRLGGQYFTVDGGQVIPQGEGRYSPMTKLALALDADEKAPGEVVVEDTSEFPTNGVFAIDGEIFEYKGKDQVTFLNVKRARRFTQAQAHAMGAAVQIWGYSAPIVGAVPLARGLVADDIGSNPRCNINQPGDPGPPAVPAGIDEDDDVIPVTGTADFQDSGYLWVGQECIYYARKTPTEFQGCERGLRGTTAAKHGHNRGISQISLRVTDYSGYRSQWYVQIDDSGNRDRVEWIYFHEKIAKDGKLYLVPRVYRVNPTTMTVGSFRAMKGTSPRPHRRGQKIIPVFELDWAEGWKCGDQSSPQYEPVTITNSAGTREARKLKRVYEHTWPQWSLPPTKVITGWGHQSLAAFENFTTRGYSGARLLKFPSGELPIKLPDLQAAAGLPCDVDELRVCSGHSPDGFLPADLSVGPGDTNIVIQMSRRPNASAPAVPSSGAVKIDDEMIYYTGYSTGRRTLPFSPKVPFHAHSPPNDEKPFPVITLNGVRRAVLGSRGADHAPWAPVTFLEAVPVSELSSLTPLDADDISLRSAASFEAEGYALVGSEVIGYTRKRGNSLRGAYFRGAFGSFVQPQGAGTLVLPLPFRYWDRYLPESDRSELAYFQGGHTAAGTYWDRVGMVINRTSYVRVRLQVRFDAAPGWDSEPTNRGGGLYEFEGPGPHELRTAAGRRVRADQIEYRVLFDYLPGAIRNDGWKQTPRIDTLYIEYGNPLVVLRREVSTR